MVLDDFLPQPLPGEAIWPYTRFGTNRGRIEGPGQVNVAFGEGRATATIGPPGPSWAGVWSSLRRDSREAIPLDLSAIFPSQVLPQFQGRVIRLRIQVIDGRGGFKAELKAPDESVAWSSTTGLAGGRQTLLFDLPALGHVRFLNWLVEGQAGDFVAVERVELVADLPALPTAERAFLWSYGQLLANFTPGTGLSQDRHNFPAGDMDNVSGSGVQAAAAVVAWRLGFITQSSAAEIVTRTTDALLALPRCHGLWPHFVKNGQILLDSEYASLDSAIALVALLEARTALGLDTAAVEQVLVGIDWTGLILPDGSISHGYDDACTERLPFGWRDFGTESWLANLAYAAATGSVAAMDSTPPTFNGSGFIDALAFLFVPAPALDRFGIAWPAYQQQAAGGQLGYYQGHPCYGPLGYFGLSAAEVPDPARVQAAQIYQAFDVGGEIPPNDGAALLGHAVVVPHHGGLVASLRPAQAAAFWQSIESKGLFTPLNNVESPMFLDEPACGVVGWNALKGTWNLGLQTLGWGLLLAGDGNPLYAAAQSNNRLRHAYLVLCPACDTTTPTPTATGTAAPTLPATHTATPTATATTTGGPTDTATGTATPTASPTSTATASAAPPSPPVTITATATPPFPTVPPIPTIPAIPTGPPVATLPPFPTTPALPTFPPIEEVEPVPTVPPVSTAPSFPTFPPIPTVPPVPTLAGVGAAHDLTEGSRPE
jgi:hypothetical protein